VYRPQADTDLLAKAADAAPLPRGGRVLDVGTGTGALAVAAARAGAGEVTAVDTSRRAVLAAWLNTRLHAVPVRVRRADVVAACREGWFDVVLANPPYVPWHGRGRSCTRWDAGADGRAVLDPLCAVVPRLLRPGGFLLLVQSALSGTERTETALRRLGLKTAIVARRWHAFGPVLHARVGYLEERGLIERGQREEELVVIRAERIECPA
jgi:release factor glutamine methyltransferase